MFFLRQSFLILFMLILSGKIIFAAGPTREELAFAAAAAAFHDEVWDRAEMQSAQFIQKFPKSTNAPAAALLQAQAEIKQGKFTDAITTLAERKTTAGMLLDKFIYWTGEAQLAETNFSGASETFAGLAHDFTNSTLRLNAVVNEAAAVAGSGNWMQVENILEETNGVFTRAMQLDSGNELISRGRLILVQAKFAQDDFRGAAGVLDLLKVQPLSPELSWQRGIWTYRLDCIGNDFAAALTDTTELRQSARLQNRMDLTAEATTLRAEALEKLNRPLEATASYAENLTNTPPTQQQQAVLKIAEIAVAQNQFTNAEQALGNFLAQFTNAPAAEIAQLTLGELHLKEFLAQPSATNQLMLALAAFDHFFDVFTNSPLVGKVFLNRGWANWLAGKIPESRADFQMATEKLPHSEDLAVAKFKVGDALFAQKDFAGARENYRAVLTQFDELPEVAKSLGDSALYQILRADLELKDQADANLTMQQLIELFPKSELLDKSLLLAGEGFSDFSSSQNARAVFQEFEKQYPNSPLQPQVALAVARTFEREQNWPSAIAAYEKWRADYATNALRSQVEFALAQANFHAGNEVLAFGQFTNFVAQFSADPLAPSAQWWVADHFFRAADFPSAELNYENIYQTPAWRNSPLYYPAQLMAGRAAAGRLGFSEAAQHYISLTTDTNCPPAIFTQAMFAYGSVLTRMDSSDTNHPLANFELATNVFAQICAANPTNETSALAWSELGDCDIQLSAFDAATNAFAQVFNSSSASTGLRDRAKVGFGIALEKKALSLPPDAREPLQQMALENYRDVYLTDNPEDSKWIKKAGLQALALASSSHNIDAKQIDIIYQRLELLLPQLKDSLELKRAALSAAKN